MLWEKLKMFSLMVTPDSEIVSVLQLFSKVCDFVMCDFVTCDFVMCDVLLTPRGCRAFVISQVPEQAGKNNKKKKL